MNAADLFPCDESDNMDMTQFIQIEIENNNNNAPAGILATNSLSCTDEDFHAWHQQQQRQDGFAREQEQDPVSSFETEEQEQEEHKEEEQVDEYQDQVDEGQAEEPFDEEEEERRHAARQFSCFGLWNFDLLKRLLLLL